MASFPSALLATCPGLVGKIARWIDKTSLYPQPGLAIAASLSAVGALKAHRIKSESDLRTNLLCLGVAPAGSGKGHAIRQIQQLFAKCDIDFLAGKPISDAGLLKTLKNQDGKSLILWDEFGLDLHEMTKFNASNYKATLLPLIMDLFSAANGIYLGRQYANPDGTRQREDLDQPCLSIYGTSTPSRFYGALTSAHAADGFISRWLFFEAENTTMKENFEPDLKIPDELIFEIKLLTEKQTNGNLDGYAPNPKTIPFTPEAREFVKNDRIQNDILKNNYKEDSIRSLYARASEHLIKVALILEDEEKLLIETVEYAQMIVTCSVAALKNALADNVADNESHRNLKRVKKNIAIADKEAGITRRDLIRISQFLPAPRSRNLDDILETLLNAGEIIMQKERLGQSHKNTMVYKLSVNSHTSANKSNKSNKSSEDFDLFRY